jgi:TPR repeat protein
MIIDHDEIKQFRTDISNRRQAVAAKQNLIEFKKIWKLNGYKNELGYSTIFSILAVFLLILYTLYRTIIIDSNFNKAKEAYQNNDFKSASKYLEISCNKGNGEACAAVGVMFNTGTGIQKDDIKAIDFYSKSCKLKYTQGCINLQQMAQITK